MTYSGGNPNFIGRAGGSNRLVRRWPRSAGKRVGCFGNAAWWELGGTRQNAFARDLGQDAFQFEEKNFGRLGLSLHGEDRWQITAIWLVRSDSDVPPHTVSSSRTHGPIHFRCCVTTRSRSDTRLTCSPLRNPLKFPVITITGSELTYSALHLSIMRVSVTPGCVQHLSLFELRYAHKVHYSLLGPGPGKFVQKTSDPRRLIFKITYCCSLIQFQSQLLVAFNRTSKLIYGCEQQKCIINYWLFTTRLMLFMSYVAKLSVAELYSIDW